MPANRARRPYQQRTCRRRRPRGCRQEWANVTGHVLSISTGRVITNTLDARGTRIVGLQMIPVMAQKALEAEEPMPCCDAPVWVQKHVRPVSTTRAASSPGNSCVCLAFKASIWSFTARACSVNSPRQPPALCHAFAARPTRVAVVVNRPSPVVRRQ